MHPNENKEQLFFLTICFGNSTEETNSECFKTKLKIRLIFVNSVFNVKVQQQEAERRWEEIQVYLRKRTAEHEAAQQGMYQTRKSHVMLTAVILLYLKKRTE